MGTKYKRSGGGYQKKIKKAANQIKVKVSKGEENDKNDKSRLIEFELSNKTYNILDVDLNKYSEDLYKKEGDKYITPGKCHYVELCGMQGDDIKYWMNIKLKRYIKEQEKKGLHIPTEKEIQSLLDELGKKAGLNKLEDKIAMLMYLTGMEKPYWLDMWNSKIPHNERSRSVLVCSNKLYRNKSRDRGFSLEHAIGALCLFSVQGK